jgi:hypothetical protein
MEKRFMVWVVAALFVGVAVGCGEGVTGVDRNASSLDSKVTICHATGSETNPYVVIEISENAIPAHEHHQEGDDIIPATAGCVQPTACVWDGIPCDQLENALTD